MFLFRNGSKFRISDPGFFDHAEQFSSEQFAQCTLSAFVRWPPETRTPQEQIQYCRSSIRRFFFAHAGLIGFSNSTSTMSPRLERIFRAIDDSGDGIITEVPGLGCPLAADSFDGE